MSASSKPDFVFCDTNAFRYFGKAFASVQMPDDLQDRVVISPVTLYELFAQLTADCEGKEVLDAIHATSNWIKNPRRYLPWTDDWIFQVWFETPHADDGFSQKLNAALDLALDAHSLTPDLISEAAKHKQLMQQTKLLKANQFKEMIDTARADKAKTFDMTEAWFSFIAKSVNGDPHSKPVSKIVEALNAHYEFERSKLEKALTLPKYNPLSKKNQNDLFDAEQLLYLAAPSLCMLTSDAKLKSKVNKSHQSARVVTAPANDLMDPHKAEAVLRAALNPHA